MRKPGKVSPTRVARELGVHINTVHIWCKAAINGEPSKLKTVTQHPITGYYYVDLDEIKALKTNT